MTKQEYCDKEIIKANLQDHIKKQVIKEIDLLMKLNHENIIKLYEYFDEAEKLHLILELYVSIKQINALDVWVEVYMMT